jgi:hypothetical protein
MTRDAFRRAVMLVALALLAAWALPFAGVRRY